MPDTDSGLHPRLYRAISKKRWYHSDTRTVDSAAFKLRALELGISVLKDVGNCSPVVCMSPLSDCFGEFVLETERVLSLGLSVVDDEPDSLEFSENHAEIMGIPAGPVTVEEVQLAEDLATVLAELSTLHFDRRRVFL